MYYLPILGLNRVVTVVSLVILHSRKLLLAFYRKVPNLLLEFNKGAVSFSHLYPGEYPTVRLVRIFPCSLPSPLICLQVTRWPGQESFTGDAKVHTNLGYISKKNLTFSH
jgi:hypothetical protein